MDFIVFSDDWGVHPSSCQHIFRHITTNHRVLWVNTVGMRAPRLSAGDLRKALMKLRKMVLPPAAEPPERVDLGSSPHVIAPAMIPFPNSRLARGFNRRSVARQVASATSALGLQDPVLVTTVPNVADVLDDLNVGYIVYYCVDDFSQWPGLARNVVEEMESKLVSRSQLVLASAEAVQERFAQQGVAAIPFPHGVDVERFCSAPLKSRGSRASPRAGFVGLIDGRFDVDLVRHVASENPSWEFHLVGPKEVDISRLTELGNVKWIGPIPYERVPETLRSMDALMLPYAVSGFTDTLAPLKLYEYLLSGVPVIATPIRGASTWPALVSIAKTAEEWGLHLHTALATNTNARSLEARALLSRMDWSVRAAQLMSEIARGRALARKPS